jgi:hypothetical protein
LTKFLFVFLSLASATLESEENDGNVLFFFSSRVTLDR